MGTFCPSSALIYPTPGPPAIPTSLRREDTDCLSRSTWSPAFLGSPCRGNHDCCTAVPARSPRPAEHRPQWLPDTLGDFVVRRILLVLVLIRNLKKRNARLPGIPSLHCLRIEVVEFSIRLRVLLVRLAQAAFLIVQNFLYTPQVRRRNVEDSFFRPYPGWTLAFLSAGTCTACFSGGASTVSMLPLPAAFRCPAPADMRGLPVLLIP